jgi:8-oxo-dGTP pyrophosphatase MutT (NUDIX family)
MKEVSFGIIPLKRDENSQIKVFMTEHREGHWGFPKGKKEKGEKPKETAQRELQEETGFQVLEYLDLPSLEEKYHLIRQNGKRHSKTVTYFFALVQGAFLKQEDEVNDGMWYSIEKIEEMATHPATKQVCHQVFNHLKTFV